MKNRLTNIKVLKTGKKTHYRSIKYPQIPLNLNDLYITTTSGDRLDLLANHFYKDIRLWWVIAIANRDIIRRDSYALKPGLEIRIPSNVPAVLENFRNLNHPSTY